MKTTPEEVDHPSREEGRPSGVHEKRADACLPANTQNSLPARESLPATGQITEAERRVLVVDDDPQIIRALQRILQPKLDRVETAQSKSEALLELQKRRYDAVISDISMPGDDGFSLLQAIKRQSPLLPVILLTGTPSVTTAAKALETGAFRYVTKPVNPRDLIAVVENAIQIHRLALVKQEAALLLGNGQDDRRTQDRQDGYNRCLQTLWVAFQPIVILKEKRIFGFEALMRSEEAAMPHPGAVLDAAEKLNRLEELGRTVRRRAAESISTASEKHAYFVNLHVRDLLDENLLQQSSSLAPYAHRVVLEITERASMAEVPDAHRRIGMLREMGFRIAVDDLGAGYAGLTSFALLEPEFVKLDMALVRDVHQSRVKQKVVRSMIELAHDMGMEVVGEGIECPEEGEAMTELGCDYLQGYLYARPGKPFPDVDW
ncbi:MAG: EAL domain-containing protein [Polyangiaceae bacterium]|nr:EAL domain-containing protein [Polyangiaceae bacterium]